VAGLGHLGGLSHEPRPCGEKDGPPFGRGGCFSLPSWGTHGILLALGGRFLLKLGLKAGWQCALERDPVGRDILREPIGRPDDQTGSRIR
jgi:hypothetical protein